MRTKVLCAAALAAGALTSMAQVYSANVVGYVNVTIPGNAAFTMIANPLDATMGGTVAGGNNIANLFAGKAGDGDSIYRWDVSTFDFKTTIPTYSTTLHAWDSTFDLNPGEAVFYNNNNSAFTVTFVGQVIQSPVTRTLVGSAAFNAIGSTAPIGGSFTNALAGFTPGDGDSVYTWNVAAFDFDTTIPTYSATLHAWDTTAPVVAPGIGFFYNNNNADISWTRNFTVQ